MATTMLFRPIVAILLLSFFALSSLVASAEDNNCPLKSEITDPDNVPFHAVHEPVPLGRDLVTRPKYNPFRKGSYTNNYAYSLTMQLLTSLYTISKDGVHEVMVEAQKQAAKAANKSPSQRMGILVIGNHMSLSNAQVQLAALAQSGAPTSPIAIETSFDGVARPILHDMASRIGTKMVSDPVQAVKKGMDYDYAIAGLRAEIVEALKSGDNLWLSPAGMISRDGFERVYNPIMGSPALLQMILEDIPDLPVVVVEDFNLWGSRASYGYNGKQPNMAMVAVGSMIRAVVTRMTGGRPTRNVVVKAKILGDDFPRKGTREEIGKYLNNHVFNQLGRQPRVLSPSYIPFWKTERVHRPDVMPPVNGYTADEYTQSLSKTSHNFAGDLSAVPDDVKLAVEEIITEILSSKGQQLKEALDVEDSIYEGKLGLGSLDLAQLLFSIEDVSKDKFGRHLHLSYDNAPATVGDIFLLMAGLVPGTLSDGNSFEPSAKWVAQRRAQNLRKISDAQFAQQSQKLDSKTRKAAKREWTAAKQDKPFYAEIPNLEGAPHILKNIYHMAAKHPDRVMFEETLTGADPVTFAEFVFRVKSLRQGLERKGVPGDVVGVMMPNTVAGFIARCAVLEMGKVPWHPNFLAGDKANTEVAEKLKVQTILTAKQALTSLKKTNPEWFFPSLVQKFVYLDDVRNDILDPSTAPLTEKARALFRGIRNKLRTKSMTLENLMSDVLPTAPIRYQDPVTGKVSVYENVAEILMSSGSSGSPKMIPRTHRNVISSSQGVISFFQNDVGIDETDTFMHIAPPFHVLGAEGEYLAAMSGISMIHHARAQETGEILDKIQAYKTTAILIPPKLLEMLLMGNDADLIKEKLASMKYVISGSSPLPMWLRDKAQLYMPNAKIIEGYGMTEIGFVTLDKPNQPSPGTVGYGLQCEFFIADQSALAAGEIKPAVKNSDGDVNGVLLVRGPSVMEKGYIGQDTEYVKFEFAGDSNAPATDRYQGMQWLNTEDLVKRDQDGRYEIVGRIKEMGKVGSEQIHMGFMTTLLDGYVTDPIAKSGEANEDQEPISTVEFTHHVMQKEDDGDFVLFVQSKITNSRDEVVDLEAAMLKDTNLQDLLFKMNRTLNEGGISRSFQIRDIRFVEKMPMTPTQKPAPIRLKELM